MRVTIPLLRRASALDFDDLLTQQHQQQPTTRVYVRRGGSQ